MVVGILKRIAMEREKRKQREFNSQIRDTVMVSKTKVGNKAYCLDCGEWTDRDCSCENSGFEIPER